MKNVISFLSDLKMVVPIIQKIKEVGGVAYLVGGSVRDLVLDRSVKDIDIEVHKLALDELEKVLENFGKTELIGKQFGVLRLWRLDVDWSLPRKDSIGRKPDVTIDPTMDITQALKRRDITMNAMAVDLNDVVDQYDVLLKKAYHAKSYADLFTIIDPYHGLDDIKNNRLRAVDKSLFIEDPLRFFRVMQFIGRFDMQPDTELQQLCATMVLKDPITHGLLARERIFEEIKKLMLKSERPSRGFRWLAQIGRLKELFPELYVLIGVKQRSDYHPEGDVFEHTMQAIDAAAELTDYQETELLSAQEEKLMIMFAALCHDLGKPTTTDANLSCHGHAEKGESIAHSLLKRLTDNVALIKVVCKLVRNHMRPFMLVREQASLKAYKRLAAVLGPDLSMRQIALLALADKRGRNGNSHEPLSADSADYADFLAASERAHVVHKPEAPVLQGRHLLGLVSPGPRMGRLLDRAYDLQIEEGITDLEELKRRVLKD
ncbi:HD domain-containing protein [bacterium]|nr:MAG: HD domain-containing protein [bacterium]